MQMKRDHAARLLEENSFVGFRNLSLTLAQCFSISRYNEILYWKLAFMSVFLMSNDLPTIGSMDIVILLMAQKRRKGKVSPLD